MTTPSTRLWAITLFQDDLDRARRFYADVFAAEIAFEDDHSTALRFDGLVVNLLAASEAVGLVTPVEPGGADTAPRFQLTVGVDDVDAECERLATLGVPLLNGPVDRPWGLRTAAFRDPGGHVWEIAHPLARDGE